MKELTPILVLIGILVLNLISHILSHLGFNDQLECWVLKVLWYLEVELSLEETHFNVTPNWHIANINCQNTQFPFSRKELRASYLNF